MIVDGGHLYVREVKLSLNCCNGTCTDVYIQVGRMIRDLGNRYDKVAVVGVTTALPGPRTSSSAQPNSTQHSGTWGIVG